MKNTHNKLADNPSLDNILADKDENILLALLSEYSERWRHSSNQIWATGAVFIPLSLTGIVLGMDDKLKTLGIAIFSIILIWIWYLISAGLRSLIDIDWRVYASIESSLLKLNPPLNKRGISEVISKNTKKSISIRWIRILIPLVVTIAWIVTVCIAFILS